MFSSSCACICVKPGTKLHIPGEISSAKRHTGFRNWDYKLGTLTGLVYLTEEKKIFLPIHQVISSDTFEIHKNFKTLNKRTFIFKLYSPKCVYEIISLRAYSMLCKITFYLVVYYYSTRNPVGCIFYFKLNFSSNLCFSSIVNTFLSADLRVCHSVISKWYSKGRQLCLALNKTAWFYFSIWIILTVKQGQ